MKMRLIDIRRASLAAVLFMFALDGGFALAQEQEVTVTYDPLPSDWVEYEPEGDVDESRLLNLMNMKSVVLVVDLFPYGRAEAEIQKTCGGNGNCTSGTTTIDGYPATWWHNPNGGSSHGYFYFYQVDVGLKTKVILLTIIGCFLSIYTPGFYAEGRCPDPMISAAENGPEILPYLHFRVAESEVQAGASCKAQISYPTDIRSGDVLAPDVSFWDSNNKIVNPLSFSVFIDGVQTSQVVWSGNTTVVAVNYVCPNGQQGSNTITIPGSGSSGIGPIATIEPPGPTDILGPLAVIAGIAVGLAGAGVVGGAILIRTIKNLGKKPNAKKQPVKQPPEKTEPEEEEDKLLGYDLRLSAERLKMRQGVPVQLAATGTAYYSLSGEKPAPLMMISITLPPKASGLQVIPPVGSGHLVSMIAMDEEIDSSQVALIVTGQAPGWQDEKRVILEIEQTYRMRFF